MSEDRDTFLRDYHAAFPQTQAFGPDHNAHVEDANAYYAALLYGEQQMKHDLELRARNARWATWDAFITEHGMEAEWEEIQNDLYEDWF